MRLLYFDEFDDFVLCRFDLTWTDVEIVSDHMGGCSSKGLSETFMMDIRKEALVVFGNEV